MSSKLTLKQYYKFFWLSTRSKKTFWERWKRSKSLISYVMYLPFLYLFYLVECTKYSDLQAVETGHWTKYLLILKWLDVETIEKRTQRFKDRLNLRWIKCLQNQALSKVKYSTYLSSSFRDLEKQQSFFGGFGRHDWKMLF